MKQLPSIVTTTIVLGVLVGSIGILQNTRLHEKFSTRASNLEEKDFNQNSQRLKLRLTTWQKVPSLGFDNLIADWAFLNFLQYFGDSDARRVTGYDASPDFFEVIVGQDPIFYAPYPYLSVSVAMYAAQPLQSIRLMEQGLSAMSPNTPPESFYVWRNKGIDELLFLGDGEEARKSFEAAAAWAEQSSHPEATATVAMSKRTAQYLSENPSSRSAQISAWTMVLSNAIDEESRNKAIREIEALGGEVITTQGGKATVRFREDS